MRDGPHIARVAALIGEQARAEILTILMADRALTATELANHAGITRATASTHLARLVDARLISMEKQGRHRYFRLADRDVPGITTDALANPRRVLCRPCLDWGERRHHLAGALGAALMQRCFTLRWARRAENSRVVAFTPQGEREFRRLFSV